MGLPVIVALMAANNAMSISLRGPGSSGVRSTRAPQPNKYGDLYREQIIKNAIRRAWPWFGWLNICPIDQAVKILNIQGENDAYRLLVAFNFVDRFKIPREIRRRIPELIREALS